MGVSTLFAGVAFVAIGSSIPAIATSVYAGVYAALVFVVAHSVGSAISQIAVGIGVVALPSPLSFERSALRLSGGGMLAAVALVLAAVRFGQVTPLSQRGTASSASSTATPLLASTHVRWVVARATGETPSRRAVRLE